MKRLILLLLIMTLSLAACAKTPPQETMEGTPISGSYPGAEQNAPAPVENGYPVEGAATGLIIQPPQDGDANLNQGEVFLDSSQLLVMESMPPQYKLMVSGSLPTPCHQIRGEATAPDANGKIVVMIYSLISPDQICTQVLQPFTASLDLGSFAKGSYSIELNGVTVIQFEAP